MQIDYEDERFEEVKTAEKEALTEVEQTYGSIIGESGKFYQQQIDAAKDWTQQQQQFQQEQTDFAIEQIQQQKDQAQKDYIKEQSGAYTDWRKQSSQHGANAEQMAGMGMTGTGYSESSQVSMWNTYQGRVAAARESFTQAILTYDNAMKDARLQGSAAMAEIAYQGFQQQLELALESFQHENQLLQQLLTQKQQVQQIYYGQWQDVLAQLNNEAAMAEEQRQFNESMAMQQKEYEEGVRRFNEELAEQQRQFNEQMALKQGGTESTGDGDPPLEDPPLEDPPEDPPIVPQTQYAVRPLNDLVYRAPSSVEGHGKLVDTKDTAEIQVTQNGKTITLEQPVRIAGDGTLWVWHPQKKEYIQVGTSRDWRLKGNEEKKATLKE